MPYVSQRIPPTDPSPFPPMVEVGVTEDDVASTDVFHEFRVRDSRQF
jgi:hypothetical protein